MEKKDEELIRSLFDREPELQRFYEEHVDLDRQIGVLQDKAFLTTDEEVECKRLQKLKLQGKDKIMEILSRYRPH